MQTTTNLLGDIMEMKLYAGYPNYGIYPDGRVLNLKTGSFLKPQANKRGYLQLALWSFGRRKMLYVHRLIAELFVEGQTDDRKTVNHIDGDKSNNNKNNLEWCTNTENSAHAKATGLYNKGEGHQNSLYTDNQIHKVCKLLSNKLTAPEVSKFSNVKVHTVKAIRERKQWTDISSSYAW
jgi:hypothetical protein